tara:strand:- start:187 stop:699 length:513 start_codon:yes stop_codon:yes gene_type:complete
MGKRSNFKRIERDFYPTPYKAVEPLLPHLPPLTAYDEPCAGEGDLIQHLSSAGHVCVASSDINDWYTKQDARTLTKLHGECFITNPPWDRSLLHPIIENLSSIGPTWLLFDADWMHTKQSHSLITKCKKVVSIGRVKWFPDSPHTGKDNCCWYLFDQNNHNPTQFYGRNS